MSDEPVKLLFAGPVGAGKTTALRSLSDTEIVSTEIQLSDGATSDKSTTTVAMDYSTITLDEDTTVHLYGIPGQERFDFMREILSAGALGAIVLLDASSQTIRADCIHWLNALHSINPELQIVLGISKTDIAFDFSMADVRDAMRECQMTLPAMCVDPRDQRQCAQLIRALLLSAGLHE